MAIVLEAITHVSIGGRILDPGEIFSAEDKYAKKLIEGKSAKVHKSVEKQVKSQAFGNNEEIEKAFMALKLEQLKDLAEQKKVDLAAEDTTKVAITAKLIAAGVKPDEQANV